MQIVTKFKSLLILTSLIFGAGVLKAQSTDALGTFTPYSLFGIGEIERQGTALNRGMGGIGLGLRDNRFINYLNPASITERDTLSFMLDFGLTQKNFYNSDEKTSSAYNTFNMHNIVFTAPIYKKSALIVGISPFSNIGYKFESTETNPFLVANFGDIKYQQYGEGSINQFFIGGAFNFLKDFSIGAEFIYYFGALNRYSSVLFSNDASVRNTEVGWDYALGAISGKIGLQYFKEVAKNTTLTVGATYRLGTNLMGDFTEFAFASSGSQKDTVTFKTYPNTFIHIPAEFSVGFSLRKKNKWLIGADYSRQDWSKSTFAEAPNLAFTPVASSSYKVGFEYIPNKYDTRYYMKRVTYRVGAYYEQTYVKVWGSQVDASGFTLGMSLPIFGYNAISLAADFGQRGSIKNHLVRERYVQFMININLHDIWFRKHRYN